jgi:hypothetical protein
MSKSLHGDPFTPQQERVIQDNDPLFTALIKEAIINFDSLF